MPLVIAGPTASHKSALAMILARKHRGEIICADSRQFYGGMAIGTACPSKKEMDSVPHHGYGILDPLTQRIDAGFFIQFALQKICEIKARSNRPILVGGTGLYLRALYYGLVDVPPANDKIKKNLARLAEERGTKELYQQLMMVDKETALAINVKDNYRIMRALEIFLTTNQRPSELRKSFKNKNPQILAHWIYKKPDKKALQKNIEKRVKKMFSNGIVEETQQLKMNLPQGHWALDVMGYRETSQFLDNKISLEEAMKNTFIRHRQYAKRQYTWFDKESFYRFIVS
jgi:tRNA dimethylallyltransferase